jgi:hypothetical protein
MLLKYGTKFLEHPVDVRDAGLPTSILLYNLPTWFSHLLADADKFLSMRHPMSGVNVHEHDMAPVPQTQNVSCFSWKHVSLFQ